MRSPSLLFPLAELVGEQMPFLGMFVNSIIVEDGYGAGLAFVTAAGRGDGKITGRGDGQYFGDGYGRGRGYGAFYGDSHGGGWGDHST